MRDFLLCFVLIFISSSAFCYNNTPDYFHCENRAGGEWNFGRGPYGCDLWPYVDDTFIEGFFDPVIFEDSLHRSSERIRYVTQMNALIKLTALYYLNSRKPEASEEEKSAWVHAILAVAHQESYWTHYRKTTDEHLTFMRGDYGHGHGLMQVDDRWHYLAVENGLALNIVENMIYSMEEYYETWKKADRNQIPCVVDPTDWKARSRSAYSAYNGGPGRLCRWTNPDDTWARNDRGFLSKYDGRRWESFVDNFDLQTNINVACFAEGSSECPVLGDDQDNWEGKLLELDSEKFCAFFEEKFFCLDGIKDAVCLNALTVTDISKIIPLNQNDWSESEVTFLNRHETCPLFVDSLHGIGETIELKKWINIRETPGGKLIGVAPLDEKFQVLDFFIKDRENKYRYYKIKHEETEGFIYAGKESDHQAWVQKTQEDPKEIIISRPGDLIEIVAPYGINLRKTPAGELIFRVPKEERVYVEEVFIKTTFNKIYYQINYSGETGFIFAGQLLPEKTLSYWTKNLDQETDNQKGFVADFVWFDYLKLCASEGCGYSYDYVVGGRMDDFCQNFDCEFRLDEVEKIQVGPNGFVKIKVKRSNKVGWIEEVKINWVD